MASFRHSILGSLKAHLHLPHILYLDLFMNSSSIHHQASSYYAIILIFCVSEYTQAYIIYFISTRFHRRIYITLFCTRQDLLRCINKNLGFKSKILIYHYTYWTLLIMYTICYTNFTTTRPSYKTQTHYRPCSVKPTPFLSTQSRHPYPANDQASNTCPKENQPPTVFRASPLIHGTEGTKDDFGGPVYSVWG